MKRFRRVFFVILSLALLYLVCSVILAYLGTRDKIGSADVALILGNQVYPDGTPSPRLQARLDAAVTQFQNGSFPKIIVSGGTGIEGVPEGTAMKSYLMSKGIPESAIIVDDQGIDTFASAKNTASIMKANQMKSVFVISQYFHIPRCKLALSKMGLSEAFHAHPRYMESRDAYSIVRELPAYLSYFLKEKS